jgi:starvation-inducible DNA-binding protein
MLFNTRNDIPLETRVKLITIFQVKTACAADLKSQAKQAHWNVKGPDFIALHQLFDSIAEAADEWTDTLAERIMQLGGSLDGTIKGSAQITLLPNYPTTIFQGTDHLKALTIAISSFGAIIRKGIDECLALNDQDSANILIEISTKNDKLLWFVESHLQMPN